MKYWFYNKPTDMRKSFYSLSGLVTNKMKMNVLNGNVFIFINRRRNMIKILHMESGGLTLYSKLLEEGLFKLPLCDTEGESLNLEWCDLIMMIEGIKNDPNNRLKRLKTNRLYR